MFPGSGGLNTISDQPVVDQAMEHPPPKKPSLITKTRKDYQHRDIRVCTITKTKQQKEISQLMLDYNATNSVTPAWSRTLDSLVKEWQIHNNIYNLGLYRENTADCDFNNGDEGKGYWDFLVERVLQ